MISLIPFIFDIEISRSNLLIITAAMVFIVIPIISVQFWMTATRYINHTKIYLDNEKVITREALILTSVGVSRHFSDIDKSELTLISKNNQHTLAIDGLVKKPIASSSSIDELERLRQRIENEVASWKSTH